MAGVCSPKSRASFASRTLMSYMQSSAPITTAATTLTLYDRSEIEALAQNFGRVWNEHQMHKLEPLFTEDADWINTVGMWWRGRANIIKGLSSFHATIFRNHNLHHVSLDIRPISENVAIATKTDRCEGFITPDGIEIKEALTQLTLVLVKRTSDWLIASGQATVVDAQAQHNDPVNVREP